MADEGRGHLGKLIQSRLEVLDDLRRDYLGRGEILGVLK
jgi:hypothetical protein